MSQSLKKISLAGRLSLPPRKIFAGGRLKPPTRIDLCWRATQSTRQHRSVLADVLSRPPAQLILLHIAQRPPKFF